MAIRQLKRFGPLVGVSQKIDWQQSSNLGLSLLSIHLLKSVSIMSPDEDLWTAAYKLHQLLVFRSWIRFQKINESEI